MMFEIGTMTFLYLKAAHIIFIVTWFAGLFYTTRLLIYITEAHSKNEPVRSILLNQLKLMLSRLWYGITWPSAILTLILGSWLLIEEPAYLEQGFMHVKLSLVFLLYLYHLSHQYLFNLLKKDVVKYTSLHLRLWNEVATLLLIAIVFLIVLRNSVSMIWGVVGLIGLAIVIMLVTRIYKNIRKD